MEVARLHKIIQNAVMSYTDELDSQSYGDEQRIHQKVLDDFGLSQDEYEEIMFEKIPHIVINDWAQNGDHGIDVIGVFPSEEAALSAFSYRVPEEREIAEEHTWSIVCDREGHFKAGSLTHYDQNHTILEVQPAV